MKLIFERKNGKPALKKNPGWPSVPSLKQRSELFYTGVFYLWLCTVACLLVIQSWTGALHLRVPESSGTAT